MASTTISTASLPNKLVAAQAFKNVPYAGKERWRLGTGNEVSFDCYTLHATPRGSGSGDVDMMGIGDFVPATPSGALTAGYMAKHRFHRPDSISPADMKNCVRAQVFRDKKRVFDMKKSANYVKNSMKRAQELFYADVGASGSRIAYRRDTLKATAEVGMAARFVFANIVGDVRGGGALFYVSGLDVPAPRPHGPFDPKSVGILEMLFDNEALKMRIAIQDGRAYGVYENSLSGVTKSFHAMTLGRMMVPVVEFAKMCAVR